MTPDVKADWPRFMYNCTVHTRHDKYVTELLRDLKDGNYVAQAHISKEQHKQSKVYNRKVKGSDIKFGDHVLVANKWARGKQNVADHWEPTIYMVVDKNSPTHIFLICDTGHERVVHRNLLSFVKLLPICCNHSNLSSAVSTGASVDSGDCDSKGLCELHTQVGTSPSQDDAQDDLVIRSRSHSSVIVP